ncbi:hypothetical protein J4226_04915 [Candidatus Pacearchaeota archaeon]|nr:hypothetical protein [Candidatus Pacearchaeota archaeon]
MGLGEIFSFCNENSYMISMYSFAAVSVVSSVFPLVDAVDDFYKLAKGEGVTSFSDSRDRTDALGRFCSDLKD